MTHGNETSVLNIILNILLFLGGLLTGVHDVGEINHCIVRVIGKTNRLFLALLLFTILMTILQEKFPCSITITVISAPLVPLFVVGHCGCCQIFGV